MPISTDNRYGLSDLPERNYNDEVTFLVIH